MPRFEHPTDGRLHVVYSRDATGLVVEVWFEGDRVRPTLSFSSTSDDPWESRRPVFWQAIDRLCVLGFLSVTEVQEALDADERGLGPTQVGRRCRDVMELLRNLQACEA